MMISEGFDVGDFVDRFGMVPGLCWKVWANAIQLVASSGFNCVIIA